MPIEKRLANVFPFKFFSLDNIDGIRVFGLRNLALVFESVDNKSSLFLGEEASGLGKVVEEEIGGDGDNDGYDSFEDENPAPAFQAANAVHFADGESQEAREGACDGCGGEEHGLAELDFVTAIPHCEVILRRVNRASLIMEH